MAEELKIREEILEFARVMELEMQKHDEQEGDDWKDCHTVFLDVNLPFQFKQWNYSGDPLKLVDIANFCMMLRYRIIKKELPEERV